MYLKILKFRFLKLLPIILINFFIHDYTLAIIKPSIVGMHGIDKPIGNYQPKLYKNISFGASRGENVSILLKVTTDQCRKLNISEFLKVGNGIVNPDYEIFKVSYFDVKQPSYSGAPIGKILDPLIPVQKNSVICPNPENPNEPLWYLLDYFVPDELEPGTYKTTVGLDQKVYFTFNMKVWKMKMNLQDEFHFYTGMSTWFNLLGHSGKWVPGEGELGRSYLSRLKHMHINTWDSWIQDPPVVYDVDGKPILDLENTPNPQDSYMSIYASYLKGEMIDLPHPFSGYSNYTPELYLTAIENTIQKYGWQNLAYTYLFDEPTPNDYQTIIDRAKLIRQYAPSLKTLVTIHYVPELEPYIDIWVPILNFMDKENYPNSKIYETLQQKGKQVWIYVSCMSHGCESPIDGKTPDLVIDRKSSYVRALAAFAYKYKANAILYWRINHAFSEYPLRDPWIDQWYFSGNGDGTLLYPGRPGMYDFISDQPITSVRLQLVEEVLHDQWYYNEMDKLPVKPAWWPSTLQNLVKSPTNWNKDYKKYQDLVERIGNYLNTKSQ